jgi:hypothetical protein
MLRLYAEFEDRRGASPYLKDMQVLGYELRSRSLRLSIPTFFTMSEADRMRENIQGENSYMPDMPVYPTLERSITYPFSSDIRRPPIERIPFIKGILSTAEQSTSTQSELVEDSRPPAAIDHEGTTPLLQLPAASSDEAIDIKFSPASHDIDEDLQLQLQLDREPVPVRVTPVRTRQLLSRSSPL